MRDLGSLALAAGLALGGAAAAAAEDEHIDREVQRGVAHERLAMNWTSDADDDVIHLVRTTFEPGARIPPSIFHGDWAVRVDAGTLSVTGVDGHVVVRRGGLNPGKTREVAAGKTLESYADAAMAWANEGPEPVTVISAVEVDYGEDLITRFDAKPRFEDAFSGKVRKRVVIEGVNWLDEPYKIVVRDRSGRLVDAREPSEAELHWLRTAFPLPEAGVAFGPDAFLRTDGWELMVRWNGGICGPDATIDIGTDVSAIRVNNTTRTSCDAVGATQWLALTLRGDRVQADEIQGHLLYHGKEASR
jgi:hypothetical protein